EGFKVVAVDSSPASLATARLHDPTGNVRYVEADALALPLADGSFDAAAAMDFLEHVEDPGRVISEASRVLRPGGVFLFHTFNRTFLAWLLAIKGLEWFVRNTPRNLHVLRLFIKPRELRALCARNGLEVAVFRGLMPVLDPWDLFRLLRTGIVPAEFRFRLTRLPWVGYLGYALKR
ncbi:MAG: methyltransferase domain-containing protein, partial [Oligoflexia bacterium]|nr:methyltransferase domain-containing protein [Oligoflexia bacterium]